MRCLLVVVAAACASRTATVTHPSADGGSLQLEIARYAGRLTVSAWVDAESNLVFRRRLDRVSFALPVAYTKARDAEAAVRAAAGDEARLRERLATIDDDYAFAVAAAFETFWKTGPFVIPADADRIHGLDERLTTPGLHSVQVAVEPDTVSWAITLHLVRVRPDGVRETLAALDLDSVMHTVLAGRRVLPPPFVVRTRG